MQSDRNVDAGGPESSSLERDHFRGASVTLSPSAPTTTTSTSSHAYLSSPTTSPQPPLTRAQRTEEARTAFTAAIRSVGSSLDTELQARARDLHANSAALEKQEQDVRAQTEALREENQKLEEQIRDQRQGLLELTYQTKVEAGLRQDSDIAGIDAQYQKSVEDHADREHVDPMNTGDFSSQDNVNDLAQILKGLEREMLVLEETCRIVEEDDQQEDGQHTTADEVHEEWEMVDDIGIEGEQDHDIRGQNGESKLAQPDDSNSAPLFAHDEIHEAHEPEDPKSNEKQSESITEPTFQLKERPEPQEISEGQDLSSQVEVGIPEVGERSAIEEQEATLSREGP